MNRTDAPPAPLTIGRLARAAGVNVETIRYYQRRALLATPRAPAGNVRRYPPEALARLRFIKRAQELGFTLREIIELLKLGNGSCEKARAIADHRLTDVDSRIRDLTSIRRVLAELIRECGTGSRRSCPIIKSLEKVANAPAEPI